MISSPLCRRRALVGMFLSVLALAGVSCGDADTAADQATTTSATPAGPSTTLSPEDAKSVEQFRKAGATPAELECFSEKSAPTQSGGSSDAQLAAVIACFSKPVLVESQRIYLTEETEAPPAAVKCVVDRLNDRSKDEIVALSVGGNDQGIGQAVYVPCGLPD